MIDVTAEELEKVVTAIEEALGAPNTALNIRHSIIELNPHAYLEELLDQATRSTYSAGI